MAETVLRDTAAVPPCSLVHLTQGRSILVLAPHPDDESLACGGLLAAAFRTTGAHVVCVTDGRRSHPGSTAWPGDRIAALRKAELRAAVRALGGTDDDVTWLGYHDQDTPRDDAGSASAARRIESICWSRDIHTMFGPAPEDPHGDHVATARIAREVCARLPGLRLFDYSVWARWNGTWEDTAGQVRFDTTRWQLQKLEAIEAHRSQLGQIIADDPEGFAMPPGFACFFAQRPERYREVRR